MCMYTFMFLYMCVCLVVCIESVMLKSAVMKDVCTGRRQCEVMVWRKIKKIFFFFWIFAVFRNGSKEIELVFSLNRSENILFVRPYCTAGLKNFFKFN